MLLRTQGFLAVLSKHSTVYFAFFRCLLLRCSSSQDGLHAFFSFLLRELKQKINKSPRHTCKLKEPFSEMFPLLLSKKSVPALLHFLEPSVWSLLSSPWAWSTPKTLLKTSPASEAWDHRSHLLFSTMSFSSLQIAFPL